MSSTLPTPYFWARPSAAPRGGIVVIMEGNGMGWQLLRVCERLAGEGYLVIAPDVYHRFAAGESNRLAAPKLTLGASALSPLRGWNLKGSRGNLLRHRQRRASVAEDQEY